MEPTHISINTYTYSYKVGIHPYHAVYSKVDMASLIEKAHEICSPENCKILNRVMKKNKITNMYEFTFFVESGEEIDEHIKNESQEQIEEVYKLTLQTIWDLTERCSKPWLMFRIDNNFKQELSRRGTKDLHANAKLYTMIMFHPRDSISISFTHREF